MGTGAFIAAAAMFGRALEATCRDAIGLELEMIKRRKAWEVEKLDAEAKREPPPKPPRRPNLHFLFPTVVKVTLGRGVRRLKELGVIDERLFNWSQELTVFRNLAAHPEATTISAKDAEDLRSFVYAIVDYIYKLTARYEEFKERRAVEEEEQRKKDEMPF